MTEMPTAEREKFAKTLGTTVEYLMFQVGGGHRKASPELAKQIDKESRGIVGKHELRPDIFDKVEA